MTLSEVVSLGQYSAFRLTLCPLNSSVFPAPSVVENTSHLSAQEKAENVSTAVLQVNFEPADTTADKTIV